MLILSPNLHFNFFSENRLTESNFSKVWTLSQSPGTAVKKFFNKKRSGVLKKPKKSQNWIFLGQIWEHFLPFEILTSKKLKNAQRCWNKTQKLQVKQKGSKKFWFYIIFLDLLPKRTKPYKCLDKVVVKNPDFSWTSFMNDP